MVKGYHSDKKTAISAFLAAKICSN